MKLSLRARYGVRRMLALARQYAQGPVFLRQVAQEEKISEKYLSQIIIPLRGQGLVPSARGAHGGYMLSKPPIEITLPEIVEPLEGGNHLVDCVRQASVCAHRPTLPDAGECYFSSMLLVGVEKAVASDAVVSHP